MADYMVDVDINIQVPVSAPSRAEAEALALRQLTVKLGKVAAGTAVAMAYKQGK